MKHATDAEQWAITNGETIPPRYTPEWSAMYDRYVSWKFQQRDLPKQCECDNTHKAVDTCCRYCWAKGQRTYNGDEQDAERFDGLS